MLIFKQNILGKYYSKIGKWLSFLLMRNPRYFTIRHKKYFYNIEHCYNCLVFVRRQNVFLPTYLGTFSAELKNTLPIESFVKAFLPTYLPMLPDMYSGKRALYIRSYIKYRT